MRIQILPLPSVMVGDDLEEPFALVFDQIEDGAPKELLYEFARQCGAKTHVMVPQTVEIVDRYAEPAAPERPKVTVNIENAAITDETAKRVDEELRRLTSGWPRLRDPEPPKTDFGWALARLQEGLKVTRDCWEPYGMYLVLRPGSNQLLLHTPGGVRVPWIAVSGDLLGEDWLCATQDGDIVWPDGTVA